MKTTIRAWGAHRATEDHAWWNQGHFCFNYQSGSSPCAALNLMPLTHRGPATLPERRIRVSRYVMTTASTSVSACRRSSLTPVSHHFTIISRFTPVTCSWSLQVSRYLFFTGLSPLQCVTTSGSKRQHVRGLRLFLKICLVPCSSTTANVAPCTPSNTAGGDVHRVGSQTVSTRRKDKNSCFIHWATFVYFLCLRSVRLCTEIEHKHGQ